MIQSLRVMTNATKAQIIVALNALLLLGEEFGVDFSEGQDRAIIGAVNAVLAVWVALTYTASRKRAP